MKAIKQWIPKCWRTRAACALYRIHAGYHAHSPLTIHPSPTNKFFLNFLATFQIILL